MWEWTETNLSASVAWLEQIAVHISRSRDSDPAKRQCLHELEEKLLSFDLTADPRKVAATILEIAVENAWGSSPSRMLEWMQISAIEVANNW